MPKQDKAAELEASFAAALSEARAEAGSNAPASEPLLLMVSGGSDSTALAYLAAATCGAGAAGAAGTAGDANARATAPEGAGPCAAAPLAILHVNHMLRGAQADADERFVQELADALDLPFYLARIDVGALAQAEGGNVEAVGRRERYAAADEALADLRASAETAAPAAATTPTGLILTAHTADDRVENFYMRSIVGTGPGGFRGMARSNGEVLHPLLHCSRADLRAYIEARAAAGLAVARTADGALWCEDATNAATDRFRTFVRHEIVPRAKEQNPQLLATLSRSMDLIAAEDDYLDGQAHDLMRTHTEWLNPHGTSSFAERMGGIIPDTTLTVVTEGATPQPDFTAGCILKPPFAEAPLVLRRRAVFRILQLILGPDARVETASVEAVLGTLRRSGAVANIQGDLAVSTNKRGTRIEPMESYRLRRRRM